MKPYILLSVFLLCSVALAACMSVAHESGPLEGGPVAVKLLVTDGMRTADKILRRPVLTLTVENGPEEAVYEMVFHIGDGDERTLHNIWSGVEKDLSGELLSLSEYGSVVFKGYLFDTANPTERIPVDTLVWMSYVPATRGDVLIRRQETEVPLEDGLLLAVGESGFLELGYTPEDTFLPVEVTAAEGSPVVLLYMLERNANGLYRVPFIVMGEGETIISVKTENGRERETLEFSVSCQDPVPGESGK